MNHSKRNDANDFDSMDEWLRQFFEDPSPGTTKHCLLIYMKQVSSIL